MKNATGGVQLKAIPGSKEIHSTTKTHSSLEKQSEPLDPTKTHSIATVELKNTTQPQPLDAKSPLNRDLWTENNHSQ